MGCPPSPEEKQEQNALDRINQTADKSGKLRLEIEKFAQLLSIINKSSTIPDKIASLLKTLLEQSTSMLDQGPVSQSHLRMSQGKDYYEYLAQLSDSVSESENKVKTMELFLCDSRCLFFNSIKEEEPLITAFVAELEPEITAYQLHRQEDKSVWLAWLKQEEKMCHYYIDSDPEFKLQGELLLKKIKAEILRVNKLSTAEIMGQTNSFGRNSQEFKASIQLFK